MLIPAAAIAIVVSLPAEVTVAPVKLSEVCPVPLEVPPSLVATPEITPVKLAPDPKNDVAVTTPVTYKIPASTCPFKVEIPARTWRPFLAVISPTESISVTSS